MSFLLKLFRKHCKYLYEFTKNICKQLAQELNTLEDRNNPLLNRREIRAILKNAAGKLTRTDAAQQIADKLNVDKNRVISITMTGQRGTMDLESTFYIYNNEDEMKKQLPRYRVMRGMSKDDRKKILDEEKSQKLKAKQAAAAAKSGPGRSRVSR
jgi:small subunit ribosomal protein S24e